MPAFIAWATGAVNPVELMTVVAIPFALAAMALSRKLTISGTLEVVAEPPHLGTGMSSSAAASWNPYWVGTK
jgi:hypothetical protein